MICFREREREREREMGEDKSIQFKRNNRVYVRVVLCIYSSKIAMGCCRLLLFHTG